MAAGLRTVKIRFTGDAKGLDRAAGDASKSMKKISDGVTSSAANFGEILLGGLKNPAIAAGAVVAGLALGSAVGAGIAAAIPLALGGGFLAFGIKQAANDPAVKAAWGEVGKTAKTTFSGFAKEFKGPVLDALKVFNKTLGEMKPTFDRIAKATAPLVSILAPALAAMAKNSLPGIEAAIKASVPLFEIIAAEAPKIATAFSDFLVTVTKNGPAAAQFLKDMFTFLIWAIKASGKVLGWLSGEYMRTRTNILKVVGAIRAAWNAFYGFFSGLGRRIGSVVGSMINRFNDFRNRVNDLRNRVGSSISSLGDRFASFRDRVAGVWNSITGTISSAVSRIEGWWNRLKSLASSAINFSIGGFRIPGISGARAAGGPVSAGRSYLVGEKGPEIVTMGGNGHVTPNHELGGGDTTINLQMDISEGVSQVFEFKISEHDRNLKRRVTARRVA